MKISKSQLYGTLGGLAVIAGASYYFYKRKQLQMSPMDQFKQSIKRSTSNNAIQIQQNFEYLFHQEVGQFLNNTDDQNNYDEQKKSRCCGVTIQQGYQCFDCIPEDQFGTFKLETGQETSYGLFIHTLCEDCFDEEVHRGHRFVQLPFDYLTYCSCGSSQLLKEQSFCKNHKGFKDLKIEYDSTFSVEIKEKTIKFFKEIISFLLDNTADQIHKTNQNKRQQILTKFNSLLTMIQNQMIQLLYDNNQFIYCLIELFEQKLNTSTLIDTKNLNKLEFLRKKQFDDNETILDYLFRFIPFYNDKSLTQFDDILKKISQADDEFSGILAQKFLKFHNILLNIYFEEKQCSDPNLLIRNSDIFTTCQYGLNSYKNLEKINLSKQTEYLNLLKVFNKLIKQFEFKEFQSPEWFVLLNVSKQIQSVFNFPQIIEQFSQLDELLEIILDYYSYFGEFFIFGNKDLSVCEDFQQRNQKLFYLQMYQLIVLDSVYSFGYQVVKLNKQELNLKYRKVLSKRIESEVDKIFDKLYSLNKQDKSCQFHFGLQFINFIIILFLLGQKPFNYKGVKETFLENFSLSNEDEMKGFVQKIMYILKFYIPQEINENNSNVYFDLIGKINEAQLELWMEVCNFSQSSQFYKYDSHILTLQMVYLLAPQSNSISHQIIGSIIKQQEHYSYKCSLLLTQILYDQTPILNHTFEFKSILTEDQTFEQIYNRGVQSTILGMVNMHGSNQLLQSNLEDDIKFYISDPMLVEFAKEEIKQVCEIRNSYVQKKSTLQNGNNLNVARNFTIADNTYGEKYIENLIYFTENKDFYKELFDFQKQLIIKEYSNFNYYMEVFDFFVANKVNPSAVELLNEYFVMYHIVIQMSKEIPTLLVENQQKEIADIEKYYYSPITLKFLVTTYQNHLNQSKHLFEKRRDIKNYLDIINKIYTDQTTKDNNNSQLQQQQQ